MPSFAASSEVRDGADGLPLVLRARHVLVAGSASHHAHTVKGRLPGDVDVILESDLVISLTGIANRVKIDARKVQSSAIANHLLNYFHVNGEQLGVRPASKVFVDEADGTAKLTLTPTRPTPRPRSSVAVRLCTIELLYIFGPRSQPGTVPQRQCHSVAQPHAGTAAAADPFSPHAFLPLVAALDRTVDKFAGLHLVRRYPLIFGPWRERYDAEMVVSIKLARAVANIIARSPNAQFRKRARILLKAMTANCAAATSASTDALRTFLQNAQSDDPASPPSGVVGALPTDSCEILCHAMERLFRCASKPIRYQSVLSFSAASGGSMPSLDDDFVLSDCRSDWPPAIARITGGDEQSPELPPRDLDLDLDLNVDTRGRGQLCFDEDVETLGGSQETEPEEDLFFSDDGSILGDADLWSAEDTEALLAPGRDTDDFDDLWASSQSTLDEPMCVWDDSSRDSSQLSSVEFLPSDPYPRVESPDVFLADYDDEDDDDWVGHLGDVQGLADDPRSQASCALSQTPGSSFGSIPADLGPQNDSYETGLSLAGMARLGSRPSAGLEGLADDYLDAIRSDSPVFMDDDLAYGIDGSSNLAAPFAASALPAFTGGSSGAPARRSPDGDKLSSKPTAAFYASRLIDSESSSRGLPDGGAVRRQACSPEAGNSAWRPLTIDGGAHGRSENGLVAGHASAIRTGQEGVVDGWADGLAGVPQAGIRGSDWEAGREGAGGG